MRVLVPLAIAAALLAIPVVAPAFEDKGAVAFPRVRFVPVQDASARGYVVPSISRLGSPDFCWTLAITTRSQPLFVYLRRVKTGAVAAAIDTHGNTASEPWAGSGGFTGCTAISRLDEHAVLTRPARYSIDVRTRDARHAAVARLRGPGR